MTDVFAPQSNSDNTKFVKRFLSDGTAVFEAVGFEDIDFTAVFGQKVTSTTQNSISYGVKTFTLDVDEGSIQVGYPVQCKSLDDQDCFMQGVVTRKDTTSFPAEIDVAVTIISQLTNTSFNWELSVIPLAGFSINPSATVGISTTSIDASGAGPFTFATQAGKLFMQTEAIGGTVVCNALNDPKTYLFGRIVANATTSLVISKIYSNATAAVAAWSLQLFDGPDSGLSSSERNGLLVTISTIDSAHDVSIAGGAVRDSTGTIDLVLPSSLTKRLDAVFALGDNEGAQVQSADLSGTISNSGTAVTGVGTTFVDDFEGSSFSSVISAGGINTRVSAIAGETDLTTVASLGSLSSAAYKRGGWTTDSGTVRYFIVLVRRDSDGRVDVISTQRKESTSALDLPSGYTYYRDIAIADVIGGTLSSVQQQIGSVEDAHVIVYGAEAEAFPNQHILIDSTSIVITEPSASTLDLRRAALTGDVTASQNSNATTIANNAVTNAKAADMAAYTLKGRNAGTTGDPSDIDITALTEQASPTTTDYLIGVDTAASNAFKKYKASNFGSGGSSFPADMGLITEAATITFDAGTIP